MNPEQIIDQARRERFWGDLQIEFKDGEAILVRKTETIKLVKEKRANVDTHRPQP